MANVIERANGERRRPDHGTNKTLGGAQLYSRCAISSGKRSRVFRLVLRLLPAEAYVPSRDLFIEKDSSINEHIEQMRLSATKSLLERRDTIIGLHGVGDLWYRGSVRLPQHDFAAARERKNDSAEVITR